MYFRFLDRQNSCSCIGELPKTIELGFCPFQHPDLTLTSTASCCVATAYIRQWNDICEVAAVHLEFADFPERAAVSIQLKRTIKRKRQDELSFRTEHCQHVQQDEYHGLDVVHAIHTQPNSGHSLVVNELVSPPHRIHTGCASRALAELGDQRAVASPVINNANDNAHVLN